MNGSETILNSTKGKRAKIRDQNPPISEHCTHQKVKTQPENNVLTLNIPSLARRRCLSSWGPRRTPWFFCNFSTV